MNCAETPTQAMPSRIIWVWAEIQSGAASSPKLTLSHSTITVPRNRVRFAGRCTRMRVLYGAVAPGVTVHFPSAPSGPTLVKALAVPEMKYSSCT